MKKYLLAALMSMVVGMGVAADTSNNPEIFPPIIPKNILLEYLKAAYRYTDITASNLVIYIDAQDNKMLVLAQGYAIERAREAQSNAVNIAAADATTKMNWAIVTAATNCSEVSRLVMLEAIKTSTNVALEADAVLKTQMEAFTTEKMQRAHNYAYTFTTNQIALVRADAQMWDATTLSSAKGYADGQDAIILQDAKDFSTNNLAIAKAYTDQKLVSVYRFKGTCTYAELQAKTGMSVGDVWLVTDKDNESYAYIEDGGVSSWKPIGKSFDLSNYATIAYVDGKDDTITASIMTLSNTVASNKTEAAENLATAKSNLEGQITTKYGEATSYTDNAVSVASNNLEVTGNARLAAAKTYADQYANQAPGYADVKTKAEGALQNNATAMRASTDFATVVKELVPAEVNNKKTLQTVTGSFPNSVALTTAKDVVYYTGASASTLTFSFSSDAATDGVYTWELMISSDQNIASCTMGTGVEWVGNDKETNPSHTYSRIDSSRTTHVFAVRQIKMGSTSVWQVAYNYSFKR